jgi:hypothetical protein
MKTMRAKDWAKDKFSIDRISLKSDVPKETASEDIISSFAKKPTKREKHSSELKFIGEKAAEIAFPIKSEMPRKLRSQKITEKNRRNFPTLKMNACSSASDPPANPKLGKWYGGAR